MADVLPIPPIGTPLFDANYQMAEVWRRYFQSIEGAVATNFAPKDGPYLTWRANGDLTNDQNLGLLATGYLKTTQAIGTAAITSSTQIPGGDVIGAALTRTNDTNVTMTLGGLASQALLRAASITLGWTGLLSVARGGTGRGTLTAHALYAGNGTSAPTAIPVGATGEVLVGNTGADPSFSGTPVVTDITADTFTASAPETYTDTNVTTTRTFDANTVTLPELADVVGTLIDDLRALGLVA